ncbi:MAG: hypothetical protein M3R57_10475, partial [Chloroflexota bacterium]|nr:hypothetical protein [Chloroflexota bacterium]
MNAYLDGRPAKDRRAMRFGAFGLAIVLAISCLTARLFYLQIANGAGYASQAQRNQTVLQPLVASRGLIYDRDGEVLVRNVAAFDVKIRPADLPLPRRTQVVN